MPLMVVKFRKDGKPMTDALVVSREDGIQEALDKFLENLGYTWCVEDCSILTIPNPDDD